MKKKINLQVLIIVAVAIILTSVLSILAYYDVFKREMANNLATYAELLGSTIKSGDDFEALDISVSNEEYIKLRVTVVDADGTVVYDNNVEAEELSNHSDRPEIAEAFAVGSGQAVRHSDTMEKNTFYYAVLIDNGMVIRVSKEASSIWSIFKSAFPIFGGVIVLTFGACFVLTNFLAKSLIKPIENVANNMDHLDDVAVYKELQPFVTTIKKQHEDILKSVMMRQEFTANVSHELKTPLTSISGYSELIENGMAVGEDVSRFAGEIHMSSKRLLSLINDILRLSELDSGEQEDAFEDVDLYEVAHNCTNMLNFYALEHDVTLHIKGEECHISANKSMLEELVYNLCDNAIRYNIEGGNVWIVVDAEEHSILVSDDGIGISEENQKRIFERFYRVDKSRSKKTGGTGLGLAIVKHIVEHHNAEIEVTSAEKVGTTIKVIFR